MKTVLQHAYQNRSTTYTNTSTNSRYLELLEELVRMEKARMKLNADCTEYLISTIGLDLGIAAKTLNLMLHKAGVLRMTRAGWVLTGDYQDAGYAFYKIPPVQTKSAKTRHTIMWTEKGRALVTSIARQTRR
ncbi:hypothetical protein GCM10028806_34070 [Spirosoma terrae]|uniref:Antirepressor protein C-terminal domain-containing protein n=1 Tax=Spirosoma terrae TaxID=1968276 RepID=A0A6L9L5P3_9BACT|nr:phage antirepressor KilAC domain-containing protein [Spirosoma terrae]NDU95720.1 hypothetical protein [Spirosoma terrae]